MPPEMFIEVMIGAKIKSYPEAFHELEVPNCTMARVESYRYLNNQCHEISGYFVNRLNTGALVRVSIILIMPLSVLLNSS